MKKHTVLYTIWLVNIFLAAVLSSASAAAAPMIEQIIFASPGERMDEVTFVLNGDHLPSTFALKGERPRVVFDFPGAAASKAVQNVMNTDGNFIASIRTGIHRGSDPKTRVVFDLVPGQDIDFQQDFTAETNTLVIRVFAQGTDLTAVKAASPPTEEAPAGTAAAPSQGTPPAAVPAEKQEEPAAEQETAASGQQIASLPPAEVAPGMKESREEATVIQPLSEIGKEEAAVEPGGPPILQSIEFDANSNRGEMIIFKLNDFNPPVVFGIEEDIPRIVCFFKDTSPGGELRDLINSDGRFVKAIKVGKYRNPDNIRVVLDLVPGRNYDLQQVFFKEDNLFMIIINTLGEQPAG
jgi:hypothetical protein